MALTNTGHRLLCDRDGTETLTSTVAGAVGHVHARGNGGSVDWALAQIHLHWQPLQWEGAEKLPSWDAAGLATKGLCGSEHTLNGDWCERLLPAMLVLRVPRPF